MILKWINQIPELNIIYISLSKTIKLTLRKHLMIRKNRRNNLWGKQPFSHVRRWCLVYSWDIVYSDDYLYSSLKTWPRGYKTFFMFNSAEHEFFSANKYENARVSLADFKISRYCTIHPHWRKSWSRCTCTQDYMSCSCISQCVSNTCNCPIYNVNN